MSVSELSQSEDRGQLIVNMNTKNLQEAIYLDKESSLASQTL